MSFSCSLKMFGWRQNSSRSGYFASMPPWSKIDTAWVIKNIGIAIGYRQWKLKNIGIGPKNPIGQALVQTLKRFSKSFSLQWKQNFMVLGFFLWVNLVLGRPLGHFPMGLARKTCHASLLWPKQCSWDFLIQRCGLTFRLCKFHSCALCCKVWHWTLHKNPISAACTWDNTFSIITQDSWL